MALHKLYQDYIFSEEPPSQCYSFGTATLLFNSPSYLKVKNLINIKYFSIWNKINQKEMARMNLSVQENKAVSLPASPFGSFEIFENLPESVLVEFLQFLSGIFSSLTIHHYPDIYQHGQGWSDNVFFNAEFQVHSEAIGHYIPIGDHFEHHISAMELRRLKKSEKEGLVVQQLSLDRFEEVFQFIERCRLEKKQSLSLAQNELKAHVLANPDSYMLFGVFIQQQMIAATIAVRVSKEVMYHFYPATDYLYKKYSPMVMLTKGLYEFCLSNNMKFFDLGTSMLNNRPNDSLIHFKEQLGGLAYQKRTFIKSTSLEVS